MEREKIVRSFGLLTIAFIEHKLASERRNSEEILTTRKNKRR
jgi:hypothetical protein